MSPRSRRVLAVALAASLAVLGCSDSSVPLATAPSPATTTAAGHSPTRTAGPPASAIAVATLSPSPSPASTPTATPTPPSTPSAPPSPTPAPTPPTAKAFWDRVAAGVREAGRLRIRVIGPAPGEIRYVARASATAVGGEVVFVCENGNAFDGQSGWAQVPGSWSCGIDALASGFRLMGQPLDAWSRDLPPDQSIDEQLSLGEGGTWRWDYRARNPFAGGDVQTLVVLDPVTGQIRSASRTDPTGDTTYGISYDEAFPPIAVP